MQLYPTLLNALLPIAFRWYTPLLSALNVILLTAFKFSKAQPSIISNDAGKFKEVIAVLPAFEFVLKASVEISLSWVQREKSISAKLTVSKKALRPILTNCSGKDTFFKSVPVLLVAVALKQPSSITLTGYLLPSKSTTYSGIVNTPSLTSSSLESIDPK